MIIDINRHYETIFALAEDMIRETKRDNACTVIGDSYLIEKLFKCIFETENVHLKYLDFDNIDYSGLYGITLTENYEIYIDKLQKDDGSYIYCDDDIVIVSDLCPCSYVDFLQKGHVEFEIAAINTDKIH